ncbi:UPF0178 protein [Saliniradius amylolyticus]|uniref:UPF0178 protein HMF8227_01882 n=1 Tax=Saliniradius amylolyticus TaxID=2183582 RepID=A0A2S2E4B6_9ALTE|nr:YaiI/YqxD family protein [Saliniradius amylolyticus]AWL12352.1 UPF0178 protein [Saliniradius amylolyticus]
MSQQIWVDADACPVMVKEILFKAAQRTQTPLTLIANHAMRVPPSPLIRALVVSSGFDMADHELVRRAQPGDLTVTADLPLADELITKGVAVITPRGEMLDSANIKSRLNMRDFMDTMRSSGIQGGGPPPLGQKDKQAFANGLDRWLAQKR